MHIPFYTTIHPLAMVSRPGGSYGNNGDSFPLTWRSLIKGIRPNPYATGIPISYAGVIILYPRHYVSFVLHKGMSFKWETECGLGTLHCGLMSPVAPWPSEQMLYEFCLSPWIFIQINNFFKLPALGIEPLALTLQGQCSTPTLQGLTGPDS